MVYHLMYHRHTRLTLALARMSFMNLPTGDVVLHHINHGCPDSKLQLPPRIQNTCQSMLHIFSNLETVFFEEHLLYILVFSYIFKMHVELNRFAFYNFF